MGSNCETGLRTSRSGLQHLFWGLQCGCQPPSQLPSRFFFSLELFGLGLGLGLRLGLGKFGTEVQEIYIHIYMLDRHMHAFSSFDVLGQFNPNPKPLY
jgi:hypothetical protein